VLVIGDVQDYFLLFEPSEITHTLISQPALLYFGIPTDKGRLPMQFSKLISHSVCVGVGVDVVVDVDVVIKNYKSCRLHVYLSEI